jgi:hypothetical protein
MVYLASALSCAGVLAASFSPAAVLAISVLSAQPVYTVLAIFAAFFWACSISLVALLWLIFGSGKSGAALWLLVVYAVVVQELARWATYAIYERLVRGMRSVGLMADDKPRTAAQVVPVAVASGLGAGVMQVLVLHGDVLAGALRPGTLYTPACSTLSFFAVDALTNNACVLLNVLLSVLGWTAAFPRGSVRGWLGLVVLHLLAAGATLLNTLSADDGCMLSLPCLYAVVALTSVLAARAAAAAMHAPRTAAAGSATRPVAESAVVIE